VSHSIDSQNSNKKAKKANKAFSNSYPNEYNYSDQAALNRRAERFQREHEIERTKNAPHSHSHSSKGNHYYSQHYSHPASSESPFGSRDEPEGNNVRFDLLYLPGTQTVSHKEQAMNWDKYTIVGTSTEIFKDYLRLTSVGATEVWQVFVC
jgi:hypothetical protein